VFESFDTALIITIFECVSSNSDIPSRREDCESREMDGKCQRGDCELVQTRMSRSERSQPQTSQFTHTCSLESQCHNRSD
jgi:hypothetical protein